VRSLAFFGEGLTVRTLEFSGVWSEKRRMNPACFGRKTKELTRTERSGKIKKARDASDGEKLKRAASATSSRTPSESGYSIQKGNRLGGTSSRIFDNWLNVPVVRCDQVWLDHSHKVRVSVARMAFEPCMIDTGYTAPTSVGRYNNRFQTRV